MKLPTFLRKCHIFLSLSIVAFITFFAIFFSTDNLSFIFTQPLQHPTQLKHLKHPHATSQKDVPEAGGGCGVFDGRWVYDEGARPLYEEAECPYIQPQLTCQAYGRPDREYQKWRWKPHNCSLPSFNATFMWEMLRGKRMMFIGDSLIRNQFASLVCLLQSVIPESVKSMDTIESLIVFKAKEYNASIEFYWAPFLVESNADNAVVHRVEDRIIHIDSIGKHARHWKGVDILVFNTYLWWITGSKMKTIRKKFPEKKQDIIEMRTEDVYGMALKKVMKWVNKNVDPHKGRVFFVRAMSGEESQMETVSIKRLQLKIQRSGEVLQKRA